MGPDPSQQPDLSQQPVLSQQPKQITTQLDAMRSRWPASAPIPRASAPRHRNTTATVQGPRDRRRCWGPPRPDRSATGRDHCRSRRRRGHNCRTARHVQRGALRRLLGQPGTHISQHLGLTRLALPDCRKDRVGINPFLDRNGTPETASILDLLLLSDLAQRSGRLLGQALSQPVRWRLVWFLLAVR